MTAGTIKRKWWLKKFIGLPGLTRPHKKMSGITGAQFNLCAQMSSAKFMGLKRANWGSSGITRN